MAEFDLDQLLTEAKAVTPTARQWFVPAAAPDPDPFGPPKPKPWAGCRRPPELPLEPGQWLRRLMAKLETSVWSGAEYLARPDLTPEKRAKAEDRFGQVIWQTTLLAHALKRYVPCLSCPQAIGGTYPSEHPAMGEMTVWQFKEHFAMAELPVTTPAGRAATLVPWRTKQTERLELTPEDLAALARVGRLAGIDELAVLDQVMERRGQPADRASEGAAATMA